MTLFIRLLTISIIAAILSSCASDEHKFKNNAEKEYQQAVQDLKKGDYGDVSQNLTKFSANYPYSKRAIQAELLRIFAAYKNGEFVLSETLSKEFINQHPSHAHVDYAKYMLAMSYYRERLSAEKDPTMTHAAIDAFRQLLHDHPESDYAKDGQARLQSLYNALAKHELTVGKFYFDRKRYVAASNRFLEVTKSYQTTPSIEEALYYLAASYHRMGLRKDAHQIAVLLLHNYPHSSWASKTRDYL